MSMHFCSCHCARITTSGPANSPAFGGTVPLFQPDVPLNHGNVPLFCTDTEQNFTEFMRSISREHCPYFGTRFLARYTPYLPLKNYQWWQVWVSQVIDAVCIMPTHVTPSWGHDIWRQPLVRPMPRPTLEHRQGKYQTGSEHRL